MGAVRVASLAFICITVFMLGELVNSYNVTCRTQGIFGAGQGDDCRCHYFFCIFYSAYNVWVRYPYNCSTAAIPAANYSWDNLTQSCFYNTTAG